VFPEGKLPEGLLMHLAGPTENGWRVVNIVQSQEQFEAFAREKLVRPPKKLGRPTPDDGLPRPQADPGLNSPHPSKPTHAVKSALNGAGMSSPLLLDVLVAHTNRWSR